MNWDFMKVLPYWELFIRGLLMTIFISVFSVLIGTIIGLFTALLNLSKHKWQRAIATTYINIIRGTPLLLQVMILFYAFPQLGINMPSINSIPNSKEIFAGIITLSINSGAYVAEIFRGGINSVNKGQSEASRALGLNQNLTMRYVIFPQALKTILPALGNEVIVMIKESSIVSVIGLRDLMYISSLVRGAIYSPFEPLIVVAIIYFIITTILSKLLNYFERRMNHD